MEIIKDLRPKNIKYKFIHHNCCEFIATGDEFTWTLTPYNERLADVICPMCGKQFYDKPEEVVIEDDKLYWPPSTNCPRNCRICQAKCLYRKEEYNHFECPKDMI